MKPPHVERMEAELAELQTRAAALNTFIEHNPLFGTLDDTDQSLMQAQLGTMLAYEGVLAIRLARAEASPATPVESLPVEPFAGDDYPVPAELDCE